MNLTSGWASDTLINSLTICLNSTLFDFKKFLLAGILKKRFFTEILVPISLTVDLLCFKSLPWTSISVANSTPGCLVIKLTCETAEILANASPLKPLDLILNKSSAFEILEVVCLSKQIDASFFDIPIPLSITWINVFPASFILILITVALASIAFSRSSLTTEAGLWTTSPAAIWLATLSGSILIISFTN